MAYPWTIFFNLEVFFIPHPEVQSRVQCSEAFPTHTGITNQESSHERNFVWSEPENNSPMAKTPASSAGGKVNPWLGTKIPTTPGSAKKRKKKQKKKEEKLLPHTY